MAFEGIFVAGTYIAVARYIKVSLLSDITDRCSNVGSTCRVQTICSGRHICSGEHASNVKCI